MAQRNTTAGERGGWSSTAPAPRRSRIEVGRLTGRHVVVLALAGLLLAFSLLPGPPPAAAPTPEESRRIGWLAAEEADPLARDVFERVNDERAARGLPALAWDEELARLARGWSTRMIETTFEHSPESYRVHPRFPWGLGENIAIGQETSSEVHIAWMESDGHRHNILGAGYGAVGIGIVCRNDGRMWATQLFAPHPAGAYRTLGLEVDLDPEPIVRQDDGLACPGAQLIHR